MASEVPRGRDDNLSLGGPFEGPLLPPAPPSGGRPLDPPPLVLSLGRAGRFWVQDYTEGENFGSKIDNAQEQTITVLRALLNGRSVYPVQ